MTQDVQQLSDAEYETYLTERAHVWLNGLKEKLKANVNFEITHTPTHLTINITGKDAELFQKNTGQGDMLPLHALQTLLSVILFEFKGEKSRRKRINLDVNRKRTEQMDGVEGLAGLLQNKLIANQSSITVFGLNNQERKAIHMALSNDSNSTTESEGFGPLRRLKILPS